MRLFMDNKYDIIIIGGGASGLFAWAFLPKNIKKLILEKNQNLGSKILLSGGGRCNFTNQNISPLKDYFSDDLKFVDNVLKKFSNVDMINFIEEKLMKTKVEDNWRVFLDWWRSKRFLQFLVELCSGNDVEFKLWCDVKDIEILESDYRFKIIASDWQFFTKKLIISTWWKSFPQIWASSFALDFARRLWLRVNNEFQSLCGMETAEDLSLVTGNSIKVRFVLREKNNVVYDKIGAVLFTHRWISWPIVFDSTLYIWNKNLSDFEIELIFEKSDVPAKIVRNLDLERKKHILKLHPKALRSWNEAKVMGWWISISELKENFECKSISDLYFIGEALDVTGRTWWFNLQWAWSSGWVCGKSTS